MTYQFASSADSSFQQANFFSFFTIQYEPGHSSRAVLTISGVVLYRARVALPSGAVVRLSIEDVAREEALR